VNAFQGGGKKTVLGAVFETETTKGLPEGGKETRRVTADFREEVTER